MSGPKACVRTMSALALLVRRGTDCPNSARKRASAAASETGSDAFGQRSDAPRARRAAEVRPPLVLTELPRPPGQLIGRRIGAGHSYNAWVTSCRAKSAVFSPGFAVRV